MHFSLNQSNVNDYIKPCMRAFGKSKMYAWDYVVSYHNTLSLSMQLMRTTVQFDRI